MFGFQQHFRYFFAIFIWLCAQHAYAQADPHQVVESTTNALIKEIVAAKTYYEKDPERFYKAINSLIGSSIDFRSFTRSVMGDYGKKAYYQSLSAAEKAAYREQFMRFEKVFRQGLVETYSKGLLAFDGQKLEVQPADENSLLNIKQGKPVTVAQLLHADAGKVYTINYKMMKNRKSGKWLVRNVTIGSVNIGEVYYGQFDAAMKQQQGDFAKVVDNWRVDDKNFQSKKSADTKQ